MFRVISWKWSLREVSFEELNLEADLQKQREASH